MLSSANIIKVSVIKALLIFCVAMLVTLCLFLFMQSLISTDSEMLEPVELAAVVELYREPPKPDKTVEPESEPEPITETNPEPNMDTITKTPAEPTASVDQMMPSVDMGSLSINVGANEGQWSLPVSSSTSELLDGGKDSKGYVEVVPYTTRRANIPLLAWQNKLNGWVLVVFSITTSGHTSNIRILDANPKGIFEESVQKAVSFWRYDVSSLKNYKGDRVLTQKVSLYWKDYPDNVVY